MDRATIIAAFSTLFLAEMGDKTQLAVITLTASSRKPASVFAGALAALTVVTALGVLFGEGAASLMPEKALRRAAATAFIFIGAWMWARP
ncbi:MAG TPA: TMEM165/GDT1 family protein [Elusimicrobiota bacterium]|jgi:putative Ca2+/H+ antiporter (TMEM165/GDT1 family)|nr:TMEM165/GDT1 family protein [Elusimicrobiota bacterium]